VNYSGDFTVVFLIMLVTGGGLFALWIWALVDAIRVPDDSMYRSGTKLVWVLVIALLGFIGAIVYLAAGRPSSSAPPPPGGAPYPPPPPPPPG
jgi:hypothetical protein